MTERTDETYYIVRVKLREVKAVTGNILTKAGTVATLGWSNEGGGWPQIGEGEYHFETPPSLEAIAQWDGMPWFCQIEPGSVQVLKVDEVRTHDRKETEVPMGTSQAPSDLGTKES